MFFNQNAKSPFKCVCSFIASVFLFNTLISPVGAQNLVTFLPIPGSMVTTSSAHVPILLKGMTINAKEPFRFDFILDTGNTKFSDKEMRAESERLVKYFLAALTVPENDLWVNLSPNEPDRILTDELSKTELGRDMLAQDYILKQLTATLMYPEEELGQTFWDRIHEKINEAAVGSDSSNLEQKNISQDVSALCNKVWIVPEQASVYEYQDTVYVVESKLKVMLEQDYLSTIDGKQYEISERNKIVREIIIPEIEKEVNQGENFATLRQIYHSLILAKWYKETIKNSLLSQIYVDKTKMTGIDQVDEQIKNEIYSKYMQAYKKGVFNFVKEDYDAISKTIVPRKYFSGGIRGEVDLKSMRPDWVAIRKSKVGDNIKIKAEIQPQRKSDQAMLSIAPFSAVLLNSGFDIEKVKAFVESMGEGGIITVSVVALGAFFYGIDRYMKHHTVTGNLDTLTRSRNEQDIIRAINYVGQHGKSSPQYVDLFVRLGSSNMNIVRAAEEAVENLKMPEDLRVHGYIHAQSGESLKNAIKKLKHLVTFQSTQFLLRHSVSKNLEIAQLAKDALQNHDPANERIARAYMEGAKGSSIEYVMNRLLPLNKETTNKWVADHLLQSKSSNLTQYPQINIMIKAKDKLTEELKKINKKKGKSSLFPKVIALANEGYDFELVYELEKDDLESSSATSKSLNIIQGEQFDKFTLNIETLLNPKFQNVFKEAIQSGFATYTMIKPDAIKLGQEDQIIADIQAQGYEAILGPKIKFTKEAAGLFYAEHKDGRFFKKILEYMTSGEVIPIFIKSKSVNTIGEYRAFQKELRIKYGAEPGADRLHAADSVDSAFYEMDVIWNYLAQQFPQSLETGSFSDEIYEGQIYEMDNPYGLSNIKINLIPGTGMGLTKIVELINQMHARIPYGKYYTKEAKINEFLPQAVEFWNQGDDFKIIYQKEEGYFKNDAATHTWIPTIKESISIERVKQLKDKAMLTTDDKVGGIDMNKIELDKQGEGIDIQYDQDVIDPIMNMQVDGFIPVIIDMVPMPAGVFPLLGLEDPKDRREEEIAALVDDKVQS